MPSEFVSGYSVREPMWHGLGTVLPAYPSVEEGLVAAGHDWDVLQVPVYVQDRVVRGFVANVRSDDHQKVLGIVGKGYTPSNNRVLWELAEAYFGLGLRAESAGLLRDSRHAWVLARMYGDVRVPGDPSALQTYALFHTAHDGSSALTVRATDVRVVCMNTLSSALRGGKAEYSITHTSGLVARVEQAKATLEAMREEREASLAWYRRLAECEMSLAECEAVLREVFPEGASKRSRTVAEQHRAEVLSIHYGGRTTDGIRGTKWGLLNAGIEWFDHYRPARGNAQENRFFRTYVRPDRAKQRLVRALS